MRTTATIFFALVMSTSISSRPAQSAVGIRIAITDIVKDDHITGSVTGLTESGRESHKVVVYVKTNKWFIHPYEQGGEGKSYAVVSTADSWTIETEYRGFSASAVAAILVKRDAEVPGESQNVREIPHSAIVVRQLKGTPDYGKL